MRDDVTDDEREILKLVRRKRRRRRARPASLPQTVDEATREAMQRIHGMSAHQVETMVRDAAFGPLIVPRSMQ